MSADTITVLNRINIEEIVKENRRQSLDVFTGLHNYGYQLNVRNEQLGKLYEYYISKNKIYRPMGDRQRIEWEQELWEYFQKIYHAKYKTSLADYDKQPLSEYVVGFEYQRLADMINYCLKVDKAVKQLYGGSTND